MTWSYKQEPFCLLGAYVRSVADARWSIGMLRARCPVVEIGALLSYIIWRQEISRSRASSHVYVVAAGIVVPCSLYFDRRFKFLLHLLIKIDLTANPNGSCWQALYMPELRV